MILHSVHDAAFRPYGRVIEGYDTAELLKVLTEVTPCPEVGVAYVPEQPELQCLPIAKAFSEHLYGGMPVELGWCNGHNTKLNCLEYHRCSEYNLGTEDFVLLLAKQEKIGDDGLLDTADVEAFVAKAGELVEVYATSLHYAPCSYDKAKGFRVLILLPKGTNTEKPDFVPVTHEDELLTACNKWLLAHPESDEAKGGAVIGLKGVNIDIAGDVK